MGRMQKTRIEWCDYSWNPIKGLCPVNCKTPDGKEYCYARKISRRFQRPPEPRLALIKEIMAHFPRKPSRIFVCSTFEIFHPVADEWRDLIFNNIETCQRQTFIILTKMPDRIDRPMPENVWLGISITKPAEWRKKIVPFFVTEAKTKFISYEPLFQYDDGFRHLYIPGFIDWAIIGRLTGHGNKYNPNKRWIENLVNSAKNKNIPIFLKDNLVPIVGEDYVKAHQAWPRNRG
jgi:protein gp37